MQNTLMFSILVMLLSMTAAAEKNDSINDTGQFEYSFSTVYVSPKPNSGSYLQATAGLNIKNTGSVPVRIAVVPQWPTLHVEGAQFRVRYKGINGVEYADIDITKCVDVAPKFSLLRPQRSLAASLIFDSEHKVSALLSAKWGRISGQLMVHSMEDNKCWIEPFTVGRVPVSVAQ